MTIPLLHDGLPASSAADINAAIAATVPEAISQADARYHQRISSYASLRAVYPVYPAAIYLDGGVSENDGDQGKFIASAVGTTGQYVDNEATLGTVIVPTGGDGSSAWLRVFDQATYTDYTQGSTGSVPRTVASKLQESVSVLDFGADPTGVADSAAAFNNSPYYAEIPPGTYKTATTPTSPAKAFAQNVYFTGANPYAGWMPSFSLTPVLAIDSTANGGIVGATLNNQSANSPNQPCGITGYARTNNPGNHAVGVFGRADQYDTGVASNELDVFNYYAPPTIDLPPYLGLSNPNVEPIALILAAGGTYQSKLALIIGQEGSVPNSFVDGIYLNPGAVTGYGIAIGATATQGCTLGMLIQHPIGNLAMTLQGVGTPAANNAVLSYVNGAGVNTFVLKQDGHLAFTSAITTTSATGGAGVLPTNPVGFLNIEIDGVQAKIPYYGV